MLANRYELGHEIGRGGMGSVWLGHDTVLARDVAIKQIGMSPGGAVPDLARAEREAHLAARINHQNIIAVFDLVDDGGHQWLVMEHVDGPTLAGLITERGAIDPTDLAPVVAQVAGALAAAHAQGIVHRDVKPSNILLTREGVAKLSDFGVARAQADASLTQTGLVTGSPAYLSPEVATGRTATAASDVWSLGATVFHALSGHPPYEVGDNLLGAMYRIVHEKPPRLEGGGRLAPLVTAMMQHDPEARPTMVEIGRALADSSTLSTPFVAIEDTQSLAAFTDDTGPTPTTAFRPLGTPVTPPAVAEAPAAPTTPASSTTPAGPTSPSGPRHRNRLLTAGVVSLVAVIAVLAFVAGRDDPGSDTPRADAGVVTSQTASPQADENPTSPELQGFAADYLTTASNDPDSGFAMLTPAYQQASGGLDGYKDFWGDVSDLQIESVRADTDALTVSYTYSYDFKGDRRTEDVTLQLEKAGASFLISGAT